MNNRHFLRRVLATGSGRAGFAGLVLVVLLALLGPLLSPNAPTAMISIPYDPPARGLPLGADALGRDVLARFLWGGASLLWMSVIAALLAVGVGTTMGLAAAYYRGITETLLMRLVDIQMAFPTTVLALLVITMFGISEPLLVAVVGLSMAPSVARVIRGATMAVVDQEYVQYARTIGFPVRKIIWRDILPNVTSPLLTELGLRLMWSIAGIAALSFLGFGIQPPKADWGLMINENRNALAVQPWAVVIPILGIALFTISGNLFAEAVARTLGRTEGSSE